MTERSTSILDDIIRHVSVILNAKKRNLSAYRDDLGSLQTVVDSIYNNPPNFEQYKVFIQNTHDILVASDTNLKSNILRAIRLCIQHSSILLQPLLDDRDLVWVIVASFERDAEYLIERIQAYKLIKIALELQPSKFPVSFARSLQAVASQRDDQLRRISLEGLRILCLTNPMLFSSSNCSPVLFDAILDPSLTDIAESLVLTVLQACSYEDSRRAICAGLQIRTLLSPLTDLDFESNPDRPAIWNCCKVALITAMRSWTGVILLTSDELGLPVLTKVLQDTKASIQVQEIIVDAFIQLFRPFVSRIPKSRKNLGISDISNINITDDSDGNKIKDSVDVQDLPRAVSSNILNSYFRKSEMPAAPSHRGSFTSDDIDYKYRSQSIDTTQPRNSAKPSNVKLNAVSAKGGTKEKTGGFLSSLFMHRSNSKSKANQLANPQSSRTDTRSMSNADRERFSERTDFRPSDLRSTFALEMKNDDDSADPVFNLADSYLALLCCSVIHSKLIDGLCFLAVHSELSLAIKSKDLLVDILRTASNIFPESNCSDLLSMPYLIEFASAVSPKWTNRSEKASGVLYAVTNAFSSANIDQFRGLKDKYKSRIDSNLNLPIHIDDQGSLRNFRTPSINQNNTINNKTDSGKTAVSLTISPIFEVAQEVKKTSQSRVFSLLESSTNQLSNKAKLIIDLRLALINAIDKNDFVKQMDSSRILGKEGKEPLKWDWPVINDMLEFSFHNPDRLADALKTKFIRRLSGFYRCTNDDKAFFTNLDWSIENMLYLETASNLYHVLTEDDSGVAFLSSDRRGLLFNDISHEIETLLESTQRPSPNQPQKNVFRPWSCSYTMSREYITLLGRLTTTYGGRKFTEETKVFHHLSSLANFRNLEYLSRLCVTSLSFTDCGFLSKHFLQLWACSSSCAPDFKLYMYNILLILLLSRPQDFIDWGLDVFISFLANEDSSVRTLYNILSLISENKSLLRQFLLRKVALTDYSYFKPLLIRFACVSEGVAYLNNSGYLSSEMENWATTGTVEYAKEIDRRIANAFNHISTAGRIESSSAIPVSVSSYAAFSILQEPLDTKSPDEIAYNDKVARDKTDTSMNSYGVSSGIGHIISQSVPSQQQQISLQQAVDCNSASLDLEGLLRAPWNIEVKLSNALLSQTSGENLKIDSFLDISELRQPLLSDVISDHNRFVKVKGIILDAKGFPSACPIAISRSISSTLMIGACPVYRDGTVASISESRINRKRSTTTPSATTGNATVRESGRRSSVTSPTMEDADLPITSQSESLYDWTTCKPMHRQSGIITELGDNTFSIEIPGEPAVFIFTTTAPFLAPTPNATNANSRRKSEISNTIQTAASNKPENITSTAQVRGSNGFVYLKEIHYYLQLQTAQSLFVRMPRHFYGELARSVDGFSILKDYNVVSNMISMAKAESYKVSERVGALWGIGHVGASEIGFTHIIHIDPSFVEWCVENITDCPNFTIRGTLFQILGLLGRSKKGLRKLHQLRWNCTPSPGTMAIAIPRDLHALFSNENFQYELETTDSNAIVSVPPASLKLLSPFISIGSMAVEIEVLNLIAKLPGIVPIFKEAKSRLELMRQSHPEIFRNRKLYLAVQELFSHYSFKLSVRREIVKLFDLTAKLRTGTQPQL